MSALPHHLYTAEEFAAMPREGMRLELIRGEIVAMAPAFGDHGKSAMRIGGFLFNYVVEHDLGETFAAETGFLLSRNPDTVRAPDVSFISKGRLPELIAPQWVLVIPDLVAEVVSSGDRPIQVAEKAQMWLEAGVRLVWVAYPTSRTIEVHRAGNPPLTLHDGDTLDGQDVVPGFSVAVSKVFG